MKKSLRILSMVLAVVMIFGSMSVMAYARTEYKGNNINLTFDDVDIPTFSVDQYATMALDEVDRMLAEAKINLDIYIGKLNLSSIDGTVDSINELLSGAAVQNLLNAGLLGDAAAIKPAIDATIANTKRANGDITVLWDVLDLVGQLKGTQANEPYNGETGILYKYITGDISLGALQGFVKNYIFNIRELVIGLLLGLTGLNDTKDENGDVVEEYDYMDSRVVPDKYKNANGPMLLLQEVLNHYVLGEWKKLDDLFYSEDNTTSNVVYSEYEFHQGSATGALVTDAEPNVAQYDYYGFVHPDRWVTQTLGDAIRVANGAPAPSASYTRVDVYTMSVNGTPTYDFVEPLLLYAYNNVAVPVLNRITKRWLREKLGYTFDPAKTEEWAKDSNGDPVYDPDTGERVRSSTYDYMYMGDAPEGGVDTDSRIFELFDVDTFEVPRVTLGANQLFIPNLNRNATQILPKVLKATITKGGQPYNAGDPLADGDVLRFTWNGKNDDGIDVSYYFDWTYGPNSYITQNAVNVVKFLLQVTEKEFFSDLLITKGEYKEPSELQDMSPQQLLSYVARSVINANVDTMWIDETEETESIAGVGFEACRQLAYQDIPQITYTRPAGNDAHALVQKALAILMDVAAYKLNAELDTNIDATGTGVLNVVGNNQTGLLSYLGDSGSYGTTAATIAKWAVKTYSQTQYGNVLAGISPQLMTSATEDSLWNDLDTVINSILPIKTVANASTSKPDNRPWISAEIANNSQVAKSLIFDFLVYPIVDLDFTNIFKILDKNEAGAFAFDSFEVAIVDTVHRIFDLLFPNVFDNGINTIDAFLNNTALAKMVSDLACTLSATGSYTGLTNGGTITGRGKTIIEFGLPIVCMILGLSDTQEFHELENYAPNVFSSTNTSTKFLIYNGSTGVNTGYKSSNAPNGYNHVTDKLYTYVITAASARRIGAQNENLLSGISQNFELAAGASKEVTVSGYTADQMLEITFEYQIKDEKGQLLNNGAKLTSKKYVYVGASDQGDDQILAEYSFNGGKIKAPTDIYVTGGLSSINNFAFRYEDKDAGSNGDSRTMTVQSVSVTAANGHSDWVARTSEAEIHTQTVAGKGGTYVFTPFKVADPAYRTSYEYAKDNDNKVIYDETTGLPEITGLATPPENGYFVPFGSYTITTVFAIGGETRTIQTRVHIYNDWGLPSLLESAVAANRSAGSLDSTGNGMLGQYNAAVENAAAFVYPPHSNGASFDATVALTTGNNRNGNYNNAYAALYAALYEQIERIKPHSAGSDVESMWNNVNTVYPYNYTRESAEFDGVTADYRDYIEYDSNSYSYQMGQRNYLGHTYQAFKDAVNYANDLINRQLKFIDGDPDTWDDLSADDRANRIEAYNNAVENAGIVSSVEAAYAIHRVNLMHERLRELPIAMISNSKLQWAVNRFGGLDVSEGYSKSSKDAYTKANTFANATLGESTSKPERINRAMNELIKAWKGLVGAADYTAIMAAVVDAKQFIVSNISGIGLVPPTIDGNVVRATIANAATTQQVYTPESYTAFLEAIADAQDLIANKDTEPLGTNEAYILDEAIAAIANAREGLTVPGGGDDDESSITVLDGQALLNSLRNYYDDANFNGYKSGLNISTNLYLPTVDQNILGTMGYTTVGDGAYQGVPVDGAIYGVKPETTVEELKAIFVTENATIDVIPSKGGNGTGTLIVGRDKDNNIIKLYVVLYRGDVNGDTDIGLSDQRSMKFCVNSIDGYAYDGKDLYIRAALDCDGDGEMGLSDYRLVKYYINLGQDFNQAYGGTKFN